MKQSENNDDIVKLQVQLPPLINKRNYLLDEFKVFHKQLPRLLKEIANLGVQIARLEEEIKCLEKQEEQTKEVTK